ncbi:hypothetical protein CEP54_003120 [Fusarium duplospermum]|uniref:Uncharacterized protein n=1 Tax=Fusarium duplospermum TaxID=1325734 RepID=A0A428QR19_9HYPO|nr:hypothetical protein CEP54_003120 [Fusarium duplospermum]
MADLSGLTPELVSVLAGRSAGGGGPATGIQKKKKKKKKKKEEEAKPGEGTSSRRGDNQGDLLTPSPIAVAAESSAPEEEPEAIVDFDWFEKEHRDYTQFKELPLTITLGHVLLPASSGHHHGRIYIEIPPATRRTVTPAGTQNPVSPAKPSHSHAQNPVTPTGNAQNSNLMMATINISDGTIHTLNTGGDGGGGGRIGGAAVRVRGCGVTPATSFGRLPEEAAMGRTKSLQLEIHRTQSLPPAIHRTQSLLLAIRRAVLTTGSTQNPDPLVGTQNIERDRDSALKLELSINPRYTHHQHSTITTIINGSVVFGAGVDLTTLSPAQLRAIFGGAGTDVALTRTDGALAVLSPVLPLLKGGVHPAPDPPLSMSNHVDFHEPAGLAITDIELGGDSEQRVEKALLESGVAEEMEGDEDDEKGPAPEESDLDTSFAEDSREVLAYLGVRHENANSWIVNVGVPRLPGTQNPVTPAGMQNPVTPTSNTENPDSPTV